MKTPLEEWIFRLADEAESVKIVACFYAPNTPDHKSLIGITGNGGTMPFWGCRTDHEVKLDLNDRKLRYAYNKQP